MKKFLLGCAAIAFAAAPVFAQESNVQDSVKTEVAAPAVEKVETTADGSLAGKVFTNVDGTKTPVDAKVTLSSEGVVVDAVQAENGAFSFSNIAPGAYTLTGATPGFAGGQAYEVAPYSGGGCSTCDLGLQSTSNVVYDSPAVYDAPASACSCGGGGGFGGGGGIGGRRLLRLGLIGGIVAIAVSGDDDDVSPSF
jgi:hypothetical protein